MKDIIKIVKERNEIDNKINEYFLIQENEEILFMFANFIDIRYLQNENKKIFYKICFIENIKKIMNTLKIEKVEKIYQILKNYSKAKMFVFGENLENKGLSFIISEKIEENKEFLEFIEIVKKGLSRDLFSKDFYIFFLEKKKNGLDLTTFTAFDYKVPKKTNFFSKYLNFL